MDVKTRIDPALSAGYKTFASEHYDLSGLPGNT